jgi:hypothetical protein
MMIAGPTARAATSSALAVASRCTNSWGGSPGMGVSSTAEESTVKEKPALRRISARRSEAEARMSFIVLSFGKNTTDQLRRQPVHWQTRVSCLKSKVEWLPGKGLASVKRPGTPDIPRIRAGVRRRFLPRWRKLPRQPVWLEADSHWLNHDAPVQ